MLPASRVPAGNFRSREAPPAGRTLGVLPEPFHEGQLLTNGADRSTEAPCARRQPLPGAEQPPALRGRAPRRCAALRCGYLAGGGQGQLCRHGDAVPLAADGAAHAPVLHVPDALENNAAAQPAAAGGAGGPDPRSSRRRPRSPLAPCGRSSRAAPAPAPAPSARRPGTASPPATAAPGGQCAPAPPRPPPALAIPGLNAGRAGAALPAGRARPGRDAAAAAPAPHLLAARRPPPPPAAA